jgi:hypothetical protein
MMRRGPGSVTRTYRPTPPQSTVKSACGETSWTPLHCVKPDAPLGFTESKKLPSLSPQQLRRLYNLTDETT